MLHDWKGDIGGQLVALHFAGNDFKKKGKVTGELPWNFNNVFRSKLSDVKKEAREVVFVMWGDWDFWKHGFWGDMNSAESGSRFDGGLRLPSRLKHGHPCHMVAQRGVARHGVDE